MKKIIALAAIFAILAGACTHTAFVPALPGKDTTHTTITHPTDTATTDTTAYVQDTSVCFQRDILPIFLGSCAKSGCHDAASHQEGYTLTSYNTIVAKGIIKYNAAGSKIYKECAKGEMPQYPTPRLDSTQLSLLARWINMGAPNDTNCAVNCDTNYTYSGGVQLILKKYCYGCHASAVAFSSGGNHALDSYSGLLQQVQNGKLLGDIQHNAGYNAMPQGQAMLPPCMIDQIKKWIDAGAQNN